MISITEVIIDIEGIPEYEFETGKTLRELVPVRKHYAICNYCSSLYFKLEDEEENTCQNCKSKYF